MTAMSGCGAVGDTLDPARGAGFFVLPLLAGGLLSPEDPLQRRFPRDRRGRLGSLRRNGERVSEGGEVVARFPVVEAP